MLEVKIEPQFQTSGELIKIIANGNVTLEDVLDDDDFIGELKVQNQILINFLNDDHLEKMIGFVTLEPAFDDDYKRCFKLPFVSAQAFSTDCEFIYKKILNKEDNFRLLKLIFENLKLTNDLNITLAGYINRIISFHMKQKPKEVLDFLSLNQPCLDYLVSKIDIDSIFDLILRYFNLPLGDGFNKITYTASRIGIINNLINGLITNSTSFSLWEEGAIKMISAVVKKIYLMNEGKDVLEGILSQASMKKMLEYSLNKPQFKERMGLGFSMLNSILDNCFIKNVSELMEEDLEANFGFEFIQNPQEQKEESKTPNQEERKGEGHAMKSLQRARTQELKTIKSQYFNIVDYSYIPKLIASFIPKIAEFFNLGEIESVTVEGKTHYIFGRYRIEMIHFLVSSIKLEEYSIEKQMIESGIPDILLEVFLEAEQNNSIHLLVFEFFKIIIMLDMELLKPYIMKNLNIIEVLMEKYMKMTHQFKNSKVQIRSSSCSQMFFLLEFIINKSKTQDKNDIIPSTIEQIPKNKWNQFIDYHFQIQHEKQAAKLGESDFYYDIPGEEREQINKDVVIDHSEGKPLKPNEEDFKGLATTSKKIVTRSLEVSKKLTGLVSLT